MNHLPLIIKREYLTKVRNKSFIIMTFVSPLIMVALIALVAYLSQINSNKERTITVLDDSGILNEVFEDTENTKYVVIQNVDLESAKALVKEKESYGLLHIEATNDVANELPNVKFYSEESPSLTIISGLERKIEKKLSDIKLAIDGVDINKIEAAKSNISITQETFSGERTSKIGSILKLAFGGAAGYLLFMFIIIYGNMIMRSIIEEKPVVLLR